MKSCTGIACVVCGGFIYYLEHDDKKMFLCSCYVDKYPGVDLDVV
jgi:hypothetical protein